MKKQFRNRGLPSLNESAVDRRKQLVSGRARVGGGIPPKLFLSGLAVLIIGSVIYFFNAQAQLDEWRQSIFNKQRATAQLLAPKLVPLRDKIEGYTLALAKDAPETITADTDWQRVFDSPSVYLRLMAKDATSVEKIRDIGGQSLRDGFSACLLRDPQAKSPTSGKECKESDECEGGEFCNEYKKCGRPSSPFNMRLLYRGLSVLSDEWVGTVKEAGTELKLKVLERTLDSVTRVDIPIAIGVHQKAKYAFVVLDEMPKDGLPKGIEGAWESDDERVQRVEHKARVGVWDLQNDKLLARLVAEASGELRSAGTRNPSDTIEAVASRARMANSCGLALQVKQKLLPFEGFDEKIEESPQAAGEARLDE